MEAASGSCILPQLNNVHTAKLEVVVSSAHLSGAQTVQVNEFCQRQQVDISAVLQVAWALVLRRYVGSDSVVFGYREYKDSSIESPVVVCGDQFDGNDTINKHLQRNTENYGSIRFYSICWAAKELENEIATSAYNSMVTLRDVGNGEIKSKAIGASKDLMSVNFTKSSDRLLLDIEHETRLFNKTQGQRIASTTRLALLKTIGNPSIRVGKLDLITDADLAQVWEWNETLPKSSRICAHHIFERQARTTRNAQAICSWDGSMTYAELDKTSSVLGAHLSNMGVGPDMVIPICFEKCKWTIAAMMAVLKAGAAFATLDPGQPTNRLEDMIQEVEPKVVLASSSQVGRFEMEGCQIITNVPEICQKSDLAQYTSSSLNVKPGNLAYVAFTSGSTGKPKGVVHTHVSTCATMTSKNRNGRDSDYGPGSRILQFASQAFAASVIEILKTLGAGGCICIPSEDIRLNNITQFMTENGVTRAFFTPSLLKLFKPEDLPTLTGLLVGGEPVLPELIKTWSDKLRLTEAIGMTEGVSIATDFDNNGQMERVSQTSTGVAWIVDPEDFNKLVPLGAVGELLIEGPCLAKEYLHDHERTAAAFIEAPSWGTQCMDPTRKFRLYRTGDLARYFNDGVVRIIGRKDNRVKLNGQRIELGDVEHHMQKALHKSMAVAADVLSPSDAKDSTFLVGFIFSTLEMGKPNDPLDSDVSDAIRSQVALLVPEVKRQMALVLPAYMVPTVFVPLMRRPTNTSGKMDRKKLRQMAVGMSTQKLLAYKSSEMEKTAPSTEKEKTILGLWANVLDIDPKSLSVEDDFFTHGGDSLRAMKLVKLARGRGILLTVGGILQNPSLRDMSKVASTLDDKSETLPGRDARFELRPEEIRELRGALRSYEIHEAGYATDFQAWTIYTGLLKTRGWTDYLKFDFNGRLDTVRLKEACRHLLESFPCLRTVFVANRRQVYQVVLKEYPFEFKQDDVSPDHDIDAMTSEIYTRDAREPTSLGEPIVRFMLLRQNPEKHRLLIRISHAQYDAMSMPAMFRTLKKAYSGQVLDEPASFIDFVHSCYKDRHQSESFWLHLLKGSQMTQIVPKRKPSYKHVVDQCLSRIVDLPSFKVHRITTAAAVSAAWSLTLAKISGKTDVVFGNFTSGRHTDLIGIQNIFGPCINVNPVRAQVDPKQTVLDFLKEVQTRQLASIPHENLGFRRVIERCTDWPSWTSFSSMVNHVHIDDGMETLFELDDGLRFEFGTFERLHDKADLWLQTVPKGIEMEIELQYPSTVVSKKLAEEALEAFVYFLKQASSSVNAPLSFLLEAPSTSPKVPAMSSNDPSPDMVDLIVKDAWAQVLFEKVEDFKVANIEIDTPFYCVWGDLLGAAALCQIYREKSFNVTVEDIIDNATMAMQMELLGNVAKCGVVSVERAAYRAE